MSKFNHGVGGPLLLALGLGVVVWLIVGHVYSNPRLPASIAEQDAQRQSREDARQAQQQPAAVQAEASAATSHSVDFLSRERKAGKPLLLEPGRVAVGDIGRIGFARVIQVVDENNLLVGLCQGKMSFTNEPVGETQEVWVAAQPTKNLVDGAWLKLLGVFEATGTKAFTNTSGGRVTVILLTEIDRTPYQGAR